METMKILCWWDKKFAGFVDADVGDEEADD